MPHISSSGSAVTRPTAETLAKFKAALNAAPVAPNPRLSIKEFISSSADDILDTIENKGYTLAQIAEIAKPFIGPVKLSTIDTYLRPTRRRRNAARDPRQRGDFVTSTVRRHRGTKPKNIPAPISSAEHDETQLTLPLV